jgi:hypothetical protein
VFGETGGADDIVHTGIFITAPPEQFHGPAHHREGIKSYRSGHARRANYRMSVLY